MKLNFRITAISALLLTGWSAPALASQNGEFDYPELMVTPRASERLATESSREASSRLTTYLPLQLSAAATLAAGIAQMGNSDPSKDPRGVSWIPGVAVGGTWFVASLAMSAFYQPYTSAEHEVAAMPAKTPREQLIKERFAEEAIQAQARLGWRLRWLSVVTNFGANIYMMTQSMNSSFSQAADGVAAAFALTPVIFHLHWQDVAEEQENYKKRIYAPIASATILREPATGNAAPGAVLTMSF